MPDNQPVFLDPSEIDVTPQASAREVRQPVVELDPSEIQVAPRLTRDQLKGIEGELAASSKRLKGVEGELAASRATLEQKSAGLARMRSGLDSERQRFPAAPDARQIDAFNLRVQEYNTALQGFESELAAHNARVEQYRSGSAAHNARVEQYRSDAEGFNQNIQEWNKPRLPVGAEQIGLPGLPGAPMPAGLSNRSTVPLRQVGEVPVGAEQTGLPGIKAPLPYELQSDAQRRASAPTFRNPRTGAVTPRYEPGTEGTPLGVLDAPITGVQGIVRGVQRMATPAEALATDVGREYATSIEPVPGGPAQQPVIPGSHALTPELAREGAAATNELITGALDVALPAMAGAGAVHPITAAKALALFTGAQLATEHGLRQAKVAPEYAELAGTVAGVTAGAIPVGLRIIDSKLARHNAIAETMLRQEQAVGRTQANVEGVLSRNPKITEPIPVTISNQPYEIRYAGAPGGKLTYHVVDVATGKPVSMGDAASVRAFLAAQNAQPVRPQSTRAADTAATLDEQYSAAVTERAEAQAVLDRRKLLESMSEKQLRAELKKQQGLIDAAAATGRETVDPTELFVAQEEVRIIKDRLATPEQLRAEKATVERLLEESAAPLSPEQATTAAREALRNGGVANPTDTDIRAAIETQAEQIRATRKHAQTRLEVIDARLKGEKVPDRYSEAVVKDADARISEIQKQRAQFGREGTQLPQIERPQVPEAKAGAKIETPTGKYTVERIANGKVTFRAELPSGKITGTMPLKAFEGMLGRAAAATPTTQPASAQVSEKSGQLPAPPAPVELDPSEVKPAEPVKAPEAIPERFTDPKVGTYELLGTQNGRVQYRFTNNSGGVVEASMPEKMWQSTAKSLVSPSPASTPAPAQPAVSPAVPEQPPAQTTAAPPQQDAYQKALEFAQSSKRPVTPNDLWRSLKIPRHEGIRIVQRLQGEGVLDQEGKPTGKEPTPATETKPAVTETTPTPAETKPAVSSPQAPPSLGNETPAVESQRVERKAPTTPRKRDEQGWLIPRIGDEVVGTISGKPAEGTVVRHNGKLKIRLRDGRVSPISSSAQPWRVAGDSPDTATAAEFARRIDEQRTAAQQDEEQAQAFSALPPARRSEVIHGALERELAPEDLRHPLLQEAIARALKAEEFGPEQAAELALEHFRDSKTDAQRKLYESLTPEERLQRGFGKAADIIETLTGEVERLTGEHAHISGLSDSRYIETGSKRIRISDHDLPPTYELQYGTPNWDVRIGHGGDLELNADSQQIRTKAEEIARFLGFEQSRRPDQGGIRTSATAKEEGVQGKKPQVSSPGAAEKKEQFDYASTQVNLPAGVAAEVQKEADKVAFSDKAGEQTEIELKGKREAQPVELEPEEIEAPEAETEEAPQIALTGQTYQHRVQLKKLGAKWNAKEKAWILPASLDARVRQISNKIEIRPFGAKEKISPQIPPISPPSKTEAETAPAPKTASGGVKASDTGEAPQQEAKSDLAAAAGLSADDIINAATKALEGKLGKAPKPEASPRREERAVGKKPQVSSPQAPAKEVPEAKPANPLTSAADQARERLRARMRAASEDLQAREEPGESPAPQVDKQDLIDLATIGAEHIVGGATKYAEWSGKLMEDVGDLVKWVARRSQLQPEAILRQVHEYASAVAKRFGVEAAKAETEPARKTGAEGLAEAVYAKLKAGESLGNVSEFNKLAEEYFGAGRTSGQWTPKDAFDAMEAGVNRYLLDRGKALMEMDTGKGLAELRELMAKLTSQGTRTDEQIKLQQFSTPPTESYVVAKVANLKPTDVVLEPSAGNGGLAVFAKSIGAEVHVNEISDRRAHMLEFLGFGKPTAHDGEIINALLDPKIQPTVVLMNPPFSAGTVKSHEARNRNIYGFNHVDSALQRLAPGGRLVAILGGGHANDTDGGASLASGPSGEWFSRVAERHNVRANVRISGREYAKYGTSFATRIIVIDKDGPTPSMTAPGAVKTWDSVIQGNVETLEQAYNLLSNVAETRPKAVSTGARGAAGPGQRQPRTGVAPGAGDGAAGDRRVLPGQPGDRATRELAGGPAGSGGSAGGMQSGAGDQSPALRESGPSAPGDSADRAAEGVEGGLQNAALERPLAGTETDDAALSLGRSTDQSHLQSEEEDSSAYVVYRPALKGPPHPGVIVETKTMATVPMPELEYQPHLPASVASEGRMSAAQLEAVAIAGQQNSIVLPGGFRASALIGDGTGVGKGRIGAGILWDNYRQGRKRLVWVSEKWDLMQDAMRDLKGIGAQELLRGITEQEGKFVLGANAAVASFAKYKSGTKVEHDGVLFTTYALIRSEDKKGNRRVAQLEQYLRGDDDGEGGYILFDESHNLKNAVAAQGNQESQIGRKVKELLERMPKLRTASLSATAATDVVNLGYLDRLGLWGPGTAFPNGFNEFQAQIGRGGISAMELIARELKAHGKYVSRTLSFKGVTYGEAEHPLTQEQKELYRTASKAWNSVYEHAENTITNVTNGGGAARGRFMTLFYSAQQRFFNLLITTLKIPTAVELANTALADGKAVVITLVNTNEAAQNREKNKAKDLGDADEIPDFDFGPKEMLIDLVRQHYPVQQWRDDVDSAGNPVKVPVYRTDENGREIPVTNPEAERQRDELIEQIGHDLNMPENPLDILVASLGGQKKVAELTGRKERYDRSLGKFVPRGDPNTPRKEINLVEMRKFQSGKKQVAILSGAAGTGISLHAGLDVANQRPRYHITLQVGWSADKQMQMFGRTHRTNQAHAPEYVMLVSDLGGEKRFVSTIARRLGSLGALTKGQKNATSGTDLMEKVNFETDQGRQATNSFYLSLLRDVPVPGTGLTGMQILTDLHVLKPAQGGGMTVPPEDRTNVTRLLNRLLALDPDVQNAVYGYFYDVFQATVKDAIDRGELDTGVKTLPGDEFQVKEQRSIGKDPKTGAETYYYPVEAKVRTERISPKDLEERLQRYRKDNPKILRHEKGKLALVIDASPIVHADGKVEPAYYQASPANGRWTKVAAWEATRKAQEVSAWAAQELEKARQEVRSAESSLDWQRKELEQSTRYERQRLARQAQERLTQAESRLRYASDEERRRQLQAEVDQAKAAVETANTYELPEDHWVRKSLARNESELKEKQKALAAAEEIAEDPEVWAKERWREQYEAAPTHTTKEHHLIGGAVMRFWNAIADVAWVGNSIYTAVDSKTGQRVVGVDIPGGSVKKLLDRITGGGSMVNASQLQTDVLRNNLAYTLEGNIQIKRGRVGRENVIQLVPPSAAVGDALKKLGVVHERGIVPIYYVPNNVKGPAETHGYAILQRILSQYPIKPEEPGTGAGAGDPDDLYSREAPEDLMAREEPEAGPVWYSQLERAIEAKMPERASVGQLRSIVTNPNNGVKADELKWSGFSEWLDRQGSRMVSKAEALEFVRANRVEVREESGHGKFKQYVLPGGENYGELLFTLPKTAEVQEKAASRALEAFRRRMAEKYGLPGSDMRYYDGNLSPDERREMDRLLEDRERAYVSTAHWGASSSDFQSHHWSEPNVLAHARFDERTDAEGKRVLLVEEIQSDWHQAGRAQGYRPEKALTELPPGYSLQSNGVEWLEGTGTVETWALADPQGKVIERGLPANREAATRQALKALNASGVPAAPFAKTWHEMVFRRMVRWAAENGFDKLAWTTGAQQAARYDLSKKVASVAWHPSTGELYIRKLGKEEYEGQPIERNVTKDSLADYIGKDAASKLLSATPDEGGYLEVAGKDLRVGGQGMVGFYDAILPQYAAKYGKKWGTKVGATKIVPTAPPKPKTKPAPPTEFEGEQYDAVFLRGQENLLGGFYPREAEHVFRHNSPGLANAHVYAFLVGETAITKTGLVQSIYGSTVYRRKGEGGRWSRAAQNYRVMTPAEYAAFKEGSEAHARYVAALRERAEHESAALTPSPSQKERPRPGRIVHSIDITPAMRESVMQGQPLFQRPEQASLLEQPGPNWEKVLEADPQVFYRPDAEAPFMWANPAAIRLMQIAVPGDKGGWIGRHIPRLLASHIAERLRAAESQVSDALRPKLTAIADEIEAALSESKGALLVVGHRPGEKWQHLKERVRHERFHQTQSQKLGGVWQHIDAEGFLDDELAQAAVKRLGGLSYDTADPAVMAAEIGAHLAQGPRGWSMMGLDRDQARILFQRYVQHLIQQHGNQVLSKIRRIAPQLNGVLSNARQQTASDVRRSGGQPDQPAGAGRAEGELRPGVRQAVSSRGGDGSGEDLEQRDPEDVATGLRGLLAHQGPKSNYSGLGANKDRFIRNLSQLERASIPAHTAALRAASSRAQASTILRSAVPAILKALDGSDHSWEELRLALIESRLQGLRDRWQRFSEEVEGLDDQSLRQAFDDRFADLLGAIEGKRGIPQDVIETAVALAEREDWETLRDFLSQTFSDAAGNVATVMDPAWFDEVTSNSQVQNALQIYKRLIEAPMAENHALNEGVFSDSLGPLDTYYPLIAVERGTQAGPGRRLAYHKPRNLANSFATGLAEGYQTTMDALKDRLMKAVRANDKAALIRALEDEGLLRTAQPGEQTFIGPDNVEYQGERVEISAGRQIIKDGKSTWVPARMAIMPRWLARELKPILEADRWDSPSIADRIVSAMNWFSLAGPADAVFHTSNILGSLVANTPFLDDSMIGKLLSLPVVKRAYSIVKVLQAKPTTPEAAAELIEMAKIGIVPDRYASVTYSKRVAEELGAELKYFPVMAPILYGPAGIDIRARLVMYRVAKAINPNATAKELYLFVNQLGNYVPALQGEVERALKKSGWSPFFTAGSTMIRNGINAWTGMGPMPKKGLSLRFWQQLTGGAIALIGLWAYVYKQITDKWPWEDKRAKLMQIPVSRETRNSKYGKLLWGEGDNTGYINFGFASPIVMRGARAIGATGAFETQVLGGTAGQSIEAAQRDLINAFLHPAAGPVARAAFVGITGTETYLTNLRDSQGRIAPQFYPAIPPEKINGRMLYASPGKAMARRAISAALELNSFYGQAGELLGQATGFLGPDKGEKGTLWLRMIIDLPFPGLVANASNPEGRAASIQRQRRGFEGSAGSSGFGTRMGGGTSRRMGSPLGR